MKEKNEDDGINRDAFKNKDEQADDHEGCSRKDRTDDGNAPPVVKTPHQPDGYQLKNIGDGW
jgi:hypothetical protein